MLNIIMEASQNFCIHQIRVPHEINDKTVQMRTLIAYIDIETISSKKYRVYIAASLGFAQRVATALLEENESDEETLVDMMLETTNLIVGSAKVIAQKTNEYAYNMLTPHFEKIGCFDLEYDEIKVLKIENDEMIIAIKEL
ncbi:MAG: hypothetical protein A2525_01905 [Sulfurimonas sp. RIFOXYD12_FULL_36_11]|jgi:hypothetical protein|nr:MAG: hypothetical protein A2525_01905 [Sulfurimonas sp. RIFOXYD12_FULL_36_11]